MHCIGKTCCKLYDDKTKCKKVTEREDHNGICNCRHARYLCEVKECLFQHARGSLNCSSPFPSVKDTIYHQAFVDATLALNTNDYIDPFLHEIQNFYNENYTIYHQAYVNDILERRKHI